MNVETAKRIVAMNPATDDVVISELVEAGRVLAAKLTKAEAGYRWLEGLADKQPITISIASDGEIQIDEANGIHNLYRHVDLKDLVEYEATK